MRDLVAITGCDSGIGKALATILLGHGVDVALTWLEENPFEGVPGAHALRADLRREEELAAFAALVADRCASGHSLSCLVNNAGVALGGPFENLPMRLYREVLEVNYFAVVRLSQLLLPELIRSRGRLVLVGSLAGRIALPFLSPYTSSKYALEGFCDSVRRELLPLGVRTVLLEVGGVATPIWNKAAAQDASFVDAKYRPSLQRFRERFILQGNEAMPPALAAQRIAEILAEPRPRPRYVISSRPALDRLETLLPSRLLDPILARMFSMNYGARA